MASTMVSPSSVTTRRTVPCMAGWEGPRFTVINDDGSSASSESGSGALGSCAGSVIGVGVHVAPPHVRLAHGHARAAGARTRTAHEVGKVLLLHQRLPLAHRVVLAQRVSLELGVHEQALEVRVAGELDPEHVEDVALPPVGGLVERGDGGDPQIVAAQVHAD